jgi:hypothetical protein
VRDRCGFTAVGAARDVDGESLDVLEIKEGSDNAGTDMNEPFDALPSTNLGQDAYPGHSALPHDGLS